MHLDITVNNTCLKCSAPTYMIVAVKYRNKITPMGFCEICYARYALEYCDHMIKHLKRESE